MDSLWRTALWQQFGATIDMLDNALLACPDTHWNGHMWDYYSDPALPPAPVPFWYIIYHTLFWLDLYLTGAGEEFVPPAPFTTAELDPAGVLPERPYTKEELHTYLGQLRKKCQTTITELSDEKAHQPYTFPWPGGMSVSYFELQLYNMRHVQEHAAQLNLFLGQNGAEEVSDWVPRAKVSEGDQ